MRIIVKFILFIVLFVCWCGGSQGTSAAISEDKPEFILKLIDKVEWPAGAESKSNTFEICVIGNASLAEKLKQLAAAKSKPDFKIAVRAVDINQDFSAARMVVIGTNDLGELASVLKKVKDMPILTVADSEGFARYGVMVNIVESEESGKLNLIINKMTSSKAGLVIDPELIAKADKTYG